MIYVALYGATSVQRVMDFIKTVYAFPNSIPVVIKPIGAAAQIGIPEAYRYAYRSGKSLIVLPEVADLLTILNVSRIYYISSSGNEIEPRELGTDNIAILISDGDAEPSKKELEKTIMIKPRGIPLELPPAPLIALLLDRITLQHTT